MEKFFSALDVGVATLNRNLAVAGMFFGVTLAFVNVVLRYAFDESLTWAGELTNYMFMWGALFGAAYGFKRGIHIQVTILLAKLPASLAKALMIFAHTLSFIYLAVMAYLGYQSVMILHDMQEMSVDLNIPMWIPELVLPLAFAGAAYRAGEKVYEVIKEDADKVLINTELEMIHDTSERSGVDVDVEGGEPL
ncbi:MAG: TRAP transporter small permease [Sulfurospirillaceae bacterium]|nr:TRAP transporter small permease [Sulfurospirillaceae bacterium]